MANGGPASIPPPPLACKAGASRLSYGPPDYIGSRVGRAVRGAVTINH